MKVYLVGVISIHAVAAFLPSWSSERGTKLPPQGAGCRSYCYGSSDKPASLRPSHIGGRRRLSCSSSSGGDGGDDNGGETVSEVDRAVARIREAKRLRALPSTPGAEGAQANDEAAVTA